MPTAPVVIRRKKAPVVLVKKEEQAVKPAAKKKETPKPDKTLPKAVKQTKQPEKPKGPAPVDKAQQHLEYLAALDALSSPEQEIARVCYFLSFLINENDSTTTLFPLKDQVLRKIFDSGHDSLMVSYIRRGDKLVYRLTPEAKEKWEAETGGKKALIHLYRTKVCYIQAERGYYDLYQFHIVVEPFRFIFHMPVELASWITEERIAKPRIHSNMVTECGLLRGQKIKMTLKGTGLTDDQIRVEVQGFLDIEIPKVAMESDDTRV